MSSTPEYIQKIVKFLKEETSWNKAMLNDVARFLEITNPTAKDVDSLLMEVTKEVETQLRDALAYKLGHTVP